MRNNLDPVKNDDEKVIGITSGRERNSNEKLRKSDKEDEIR